MVGTTELERDLATRWRRWALALAAIAVVSTIAVGWLARERWRELERPTVIPAETAARAPKPPEEPRDPKLRLRAVESDALSGWADDAVASAVPALRRSCGVWKRRDPTAAAARSPIGGRVDDWLPFCAALDGLAATDDDLLREVVERELRPWAVTDDGDPAGLFTGYYEPTLRGSRRRTGSSQTPLYRRPPELVTVDLSAFRQDLAGRRIAGRLDHGTLAPYEDRAEIERGALRGRGLELVWVDDPVDAFFLQIQGSGRIELAGGGIMRVGYSSHNGHPYSAIGRELVERGELTLEAVSMQSIRAWLVAHPQEGAEVMNTNTSFVFFRELTGEGPLGSLGVPLTPRRSLAVDRRFLPLGAPIWLEATAPSGAAGEPDRTLQRLMVAQDTGGAIRGPVRGDVFWGSGAEAAEIAGRMKHEGRLFVFLPRSIAIDAELVEGVDG